MTGVEHYGILQVLTFEKGFFMDLQNSTIEKWVLKKQGFQDVVIRKKNFYGNITWQMLGYVNRYGDERWVDLNPEVFTEELIRIQIKKYNGFQC